MSRGLKLSLIHISFNDEPNALNRAVMHSVLHCIFRHPFVSDKINQPLWNLACDIAVETIITEMDSELLKCKGEQYQEETIANLKSTLKSMTAERIYKYLNAVSYTHLFLQDLKYPLPPLQT